MDAQTQTAGLRSAVCLSVCRRRPWLGRGRETPGDRKHFSACKCRCVHVSAMREAGSEGGRAGVQYVLVLRET